jgi:hypothetical protein
MRKLHVVELTDEGDELIGYGVCVETVRRIDERTEQTDYAALPGVHGVRSEAHAVAETASGLIAGAFTADEWALIAEALESHLYWQVSDPSRRDSGNVLEPLTDEEREIEALEDRVNALLRS